MSQAPRSDGVQKGPALADAEMEHDRPAALLELRDLSVSLGKRGPLVLDSLTLSIDRGEILGLVGESGAGKSVTGAAITGLLRAPLLHTGGQILFDGQRIDTLSAPRMRLLRGTGIGMVFQDPQTALNPVFTVGRQLTETIAEHTSLRGAALRERAVQLLTDVGIPAAEERLGSYPFQFSGGMRQRVVIALALAGSPRLIIADEPTTALDVSIQGQILALLRDLAERTGVAILLITHDIGVIAEAADRVAVLYAGRLAEVGPTEAVLRRPTHPYTRGLVGSIPEIGAGLDRLPQIPGAMPRAGALPGGCAFHPRCEAAIARCAESVPLLSARRGGGSVACWVAEP